MGIPRWLRVGLTMLAIYSAETVLAQTDRARDDPRPKSQSAAAGSAAYMPHDQVEAGELGVALYPGAKQRQAGEWRMSDPHSEGAESLLTVTLYSEDAITQVKTFYVAALSVPDSAIYEFMSPQGLVVSITQERNAHYTINVVLQENTKTKGTRITVNRATAGVRPPPLR